VWLEGNSILYAGHRYDRNLALARLGTLPFFILAALLVFAWTRRLAGEWAAGCATVLFTTLPPVLAQAGLATTDMAITATMGLACYVAALWLERPSAGRSVGLGVAIALAVLSKFSALLFLPAAAVAMAICRRVGVEPAEPALSRPARTRYLRLAAIALILTVWAGYRFSIGPLLPPEQASANVAGVHRPSTELDRLAQAPVLPAPALFQGLGQLVAKNRAGHKSYLLGEVRTTGWWYFFPVALLVKTPIPFLLFLAVGLVVIHGRPGRERRRLLEPAVIAGAIILVCLPSHINIGLRHLLPIYPFLAITAGLGAASLLRSGRALASSVGAALIAWQVLAGVRTHPDYLAYFNELAGRHPERILVDSDLDDGQDLKRLADTLRARRIPAIWLAYAGSATVAEHRLPPVRWLQPHERVHGWVAASLYAIKLGSLDRPGHDDFAWLEEYQPVALVGHSIRLYYIP
jgi:4-amino-4-deoxy-L-arabinose transferase-like glycosyltransferase